MINRRRTEELALEKQKPRTKVSTTLTCRASKDFARAELNERCDANVHSTRNIGWVPKSLQSASEPGRFACALPLLIWNHPLPILGLRSTTWAMLV